MLETPPENIWLQYHGDDGPDDVPVDMADITWCNEQIFDSDIQYIRADVARRYLERCAELEAENLRLRAELKGPDGFETWKDAAVHERLLRVNADRKAREEIIKLCEERAKIYEDKLIKNPNRHNADDLRCSAWQCNSIADLIRATIPEEPT